MKPVEILLVTSGNQYTNYSFTEYLGFGYLAAVLRKSGFDVEILDRHTMNVDIKSFAPEVSKRAEGKLIGFAAMSGTALNDISFILDYFKQNSVKPLHIALGGILPSLVPLEVLNRFPDVDSVICYEGELSFTELALRLQKGEMLEKLPGRAYRKKNEEIVLSGPSPYVSDLDTLPNPERDTLPDVLKNNGHALIQGSRGCYGNCTFCIQHYLNQKLTGGIWRGRNPKKIVDEIISLIDKYNIGEYSFVDENFFCNNEKGNRRALDFAALLKQEGIRLPFAISARASDINEKTLVKLMDAGLACIAVGIEAGTQKILDRYNKMTSLKMNIEALRLIKRIGLSLNMGFIMINPESTIDEINENLLFLRNEAIGISHFFGGIAHRLKNTLRIYPGSPLFDHYRKNDLLKMKRDERGDPYQFRYEFNDAKVALFISILERILYPMEKISEEMECGRKTENRSFLKQILTKIDEISIELALEIINHIMKNNLNKSCKIEEYVKDLECKVNKYCEDLTILPDFRIIKEDEFEYN